MLSASLNKTFPSFLPIQRKKTKFKIPGYTSYLTNKENSTRCGLATLITNIIPHIQIKYRATNNNTEVLGLTIQHNTMPIDIINVCITPQAAHTKLTLDNYNIISPNHILILLGEFNCHNTLRGGVGDGGGGEWWF